MIKSKDFLTPAIERGFNFWTGVPCSFLSPFINSVIASNELDYIGATSEGEAVGIAAGAYLGGRKTVVICQNSGLGNTINPLTSLNFPFKIPTLLIVTHRGAPDIKDEPQHELMGKITTDLLDAIEVPWEVFPNNSDEVIPCLDKAEKYMNATGLPFALIMKKGQVEKCPTPSVTRGELKKTIIQGSHTQSPTQWMMRLDAIGIVRKAMDEDCAFIATTGKMGRELFELGHRPNNIYTVGSMGCASGIGLGLCQSKKSKQKIVVLDGDGAALMKMGTMATIGHQKPSDFIHLLIDNEAHESTGGQSTVSSTVDFASVAAACGYELCIRADTKENLEAAVNQASKQNGPVLIHIKTLVGSDPSLGRPTLTPVQVKNQFMQWWSK